MKAIKKKLIKKNKNYNVKKLFLPLSNLKIILYKILF